jgi:hypothetical protein
MYVRLHKIFALGRDLSAHSYFLTSRGRQTASCTIPAAITFFEAEAIDEDNLSLSTVDAGDDCQNWGGNAIDTTTISATV